MQLEYIIIITNNVRDDKLNPRLGYNVVRLDKLHNTCTIGVIVDRIFLRTIWYYDYTGLCWYVLDLIVL